MPEVGAGGEDAFLDELAATWRRLRPVARRAWARAMAVRLSRVSLRGLLRVSCSEAERRGLAFNLRAPGCGRGSSAAAPSFCRRGHRDAVAVEPLWQSCGR